MKYNTICFLFETPILNIYYHKYGIDRLEQLGYSVKMFDLSPVLNLKAHKAIKSDLIDYNSNQVSLCLSKQDFRLKLKSITGKAFMVLTFDFSLPYYFIYKELTKKEFHYCNLSRMDTSIEIITRDYFGLKLKNYIKNISFSTVMNTMFSRLPRKLLRLRSTDFIILGGSKNSDLYLNINLCDENTKIEYIHSFDYEHYLEIKDKELNNPVDKYCVFIDQYLPYHPDKSQDGFSINADQYYSELRSFFHIIEQEIKIKVIVSAHPRADYDKYPHIWNGYSIKKGYTAELIKDCEFVFTHFSTAVSYVALFNKPVFFISNNDIMKFSLKQKYVELYSNELGTDFLNLSIVSSEEAVDFISNLTVNDEKYNNYIEHYIKFNYNSINRFESFWNVFSKLIE